MERNQRRGRSLIGAVVALAVLAGAPGAMAHEGGSRCTAVLAPYGATGAYEGTCTAPFQGFPVGVAGVYRADDPANPAYRSGLDADVHVEITALLNNGTSRPLGVECVKPPPNTDIARCFYEYNPITSDPTGPISVTAPEPVPAEIVALKCNAHSHAVYPKSATPSGAFACWSTDEARDDLRDDYWFQNNGFPPPGS
jgi:hypothetical protein